MLHRVLLLFYSQLRTTLYLSKLRNLKYSKQLRKRLIRHMVSRCSLELKSFRQHRHLCLPKRQHRHHLKDLEVLRNRDFRQMYLHLRQLLFRKEPLLSLR